MRWPVLLALPILAACEGQQPGFGFPILAPIPQFSTDCVSDAGCVLVESHDPCECGCDLRAISASAMVDFDRWWAERLEDCAPQVCPLCDDLPIVTPVCVEGTCQVVEIDEGPPGPGEGVVD